MLSEYKFNSRTRTLVTHTVRQAPNGEWWCDCEAGINGIECWHLRKVLGELTVERIMKAKEAIGTSINFKQLIQEQWEYIHQHNMRRHW